MEGIRETLHEHYKIIYEGFVDDTSQVDTSQVRFYEFLSHAFVMLVKSFSTSLHVYFVVYLFIAWYQSLESC